MSTTTPIHRTYLFVGPCPLTRGAARIFAVFFLALGYLPWTVGLIRLVTIDSAFLAAGPDSGWTIVQAIGWAAAGVAGILLVLLPLRKSRRWALWPATLPLFAVKLWALVNDGSTALPYLFTPGETASVLLFLLAGLGALAGSVYPLILAAYGLGVWTPNRLASVSATVAIVICIAANVIQIVNAGLLTALVLVAIFGVLLAMTQPRAMLFLQLYWPPTRATARAWQLAAQADQHGRSKEYDEAVRIAEQALGLDPQCIYAWGALGSARHGLGDEDGGRAAIAQGLRLQPDSGWLIARLGNLEGTSRNYERAADAFARAVALGFDGARIRYWLAISLDRAGHREEAIVHAREAVNLDPKGTDYEELLTLLTDSETAPDAAAGLNRL